MSILSVDLWADFTRYCLCADDFHRAFIVCISGSESTSLSVANCEVLSSRPEIKPSGYGTE